MSFEKMNKADLLEAAATLDVQVEEKDTKAEIIEEIDLSGYSYDDYAELTGLNSKEEDEEVLAEPAVVEEEAVDEDVVEETVVEEKPATEKPAPDASGKLLLLFTGSNASYKIGRLVFTRAKPFKVVDAALANRLANSQPNRFKIATEQEVKHFYGGSR